MRFFSTLCIAIATMLTANAQILDVSPVFPNENDMVTIVYDATQGNGALVGVNTVYAHTGLITSNSQNQNDWQHVQGNWGTVDANVVMTNLGNNKHQIQFQIQSFYGLPGGETAQRMAFVFRNQDGSIVGRAADGSDIYYDVYGSGLYAAFLNPSDQSIILQTAANFNIEAAASQNCDLKLYDNGSLLHSVTNNELNYTLNAGAVGNHTVILEANNGSIIARDTFYYAVNPTLVVQNPPANTKNGINYINSNTVILRLLAPFKNYVYVIGDFNNWQANTDYFMKRSTDGNTYWLEISGLTPNQMYGFQYFIDGDIKVADPYCELVLDQFNDGFIDQNTWPNLPDYPLLKTSGIVSLMHPSKPGFSWTVNNFQKPAKTDLIIYELLVRDFIASHNYQTLVDTLDYLENLGINAIELMPVCEFEGNDSWGYNVSFHAALDKYYGNPENFKIFVDECHKRGIAVILDAVFNHAFSQAVVCQLYWDNVGFEPLPNNIYMNVNAMHPFNVGYDFNHQSPATQQYMDQINQYWIEEYKIDGFRFDLSKGFTQNNTGQDVGAWGQYDASRIALLKRMADHIWSVDPDSYVILEHFSENSEEKELADYGMMLWGNLNHEFSEGTMGYTSNFSWGSYKQRGWNDPHLVTYMESHDEERLMFKNLQFGNSAGSYDVKDLATALDRIELAATFLLTIPGPKMIWQFGELGYDYSIDFDCRTCPKPIKWNYLNNPNRKDIYEVYRALNHLKKQDAFNTNDFSLDVTNRTKRIHINHPSTKVVVLGNFDVVSHDVDPAFHFTGKWYDYFAQDSTSVTNTNEIMNLQAGEYRIYTSQFIQKPSGVAISDVPQLGAQASILVYPNPNNGSFMVDISNIKNHAQCQIFDQSAKLIHESAINQQQLISIKDLAQGVYYLKLVEQHVSAQQLFIVE